jgi:hypothetical protein
MNFINFNFVTLNELNFGKFINKERDAENFILQSNLVNFVPPPSFQELRFRYCLSGGKIGLRRPIVNSYKTPHLYEGYIS